MDSKYLFSKVAPTKLFFIAAIPGAVSMLASALYQLLDGIFVGQLLGDTAFAALNLAICGVNLPAELLAGPAETNPMQTFSALAGQSDYLAQAARSAKELAVLGLAAVPLFVSAVILWQLAGHIKRPDRNRKQSAFPEKEQASARWRYHAPTCPKKTTD